MKNIIKLLWPFAVVKNESFDSTDSTDSTDSPSTQYQTFSFLQYSNNRFSPEFQTLFGIGFHLAISVIAAYIVFKHMASVGNPTILCMLYSLVAFIFSTYVIILYALYLIFNMVDMPNKNTSISTLKSSTALKTIGQLATKLSPTTTRSVTTGPPVLKLTPGNTIRNQSELNTSVENASNEIAQEE